MFIFGKHKVNELSDAELIVHYQKRGDKKYLSPLFERYSHLMFGLCMKYLKNEAESQDAVLSIFEKLISDLKHQQVKSFKSWIYVVSKNHCLMHLRASSSAKTKLNNFQHEIGEEPLDLSVEKEQQLNHLEDAMKELKEEQQLCLKLFYLDEKCYNEVAEITGFSLNNVKSYIQNGKRNLKIKLMENYGSVFTS